MISVGTILEVLPIVADQLMSNLIKTTLEVSKPQKQYLGQALPCLVQQQPSIRILQTLNSTSNPESNK
jgi:hypothetical protein